MAKKLEMTFDLNTVEHLGISMYAKLPPVLAELIANAYDADATEVTIFFNDANEEKSIIVKDNGCGMTFDELNEHYLRIGRKKRDKNEKSPSGKRKVIGKKGIGKLSVFGVAEEVQIDTVKDGIKNSFSMNIQAIRNASETKTYNPQILIQDEVCREPNGTTIRLLKMKRKSPFEGQSTAIDLARRFLIFDNSFNVQIVMNGNTSESIAVTNALRFENIQQEFEWNIPQDFQKDTGYQFAAQIHGKIIATKTPLPPSLNGICLVSRGKLVNANEFFDARNSDFAHAYITGWLEVDFVDDFPKEVISTNRESLIWEDEDAIALRSHLSQLVQFISQNHRHLRSERKKSEVEKILNTSTDKWLETLQLDTERSLARKMFNTIFDDQSMSVDKASELAMYVRDNFNFVAFRQFAEQVDAANDPNGAQLVGLMKQWKIVEKAEFYKLAIARVETIHKFEQYIDANAREVPVIHDFLAEFPWLLDPRIMNFEDEKRYSKMLKDKFPDEDIEIEQDRRLDFVCIDFVGLIFVIELKRPKTVINEKILDQALEYQAFMEAHFGNATQREVYVFILGDRLADTAVTRKKAHNAASGKVYWKNYEELLTSAKRYHQEFIDKYEELNLNK